MSDAIRSTLDIKRGLLKRHFYTAGAKGVILEIQRRLHKISRWAAEDADALAEAQGMDGEARSVRMLNVYAFRESSAKRFVDGYREKLKLIYSDPPTQSLH